MLIASTVIDRTNRRHSAIRCFVICAGLAFQPEVAALGASDSPHATNVPATDNDGNADEPGEPESKSDSDLQQRRQKLKAAMYVVGGIAFVGYTLHIVAGAPVKSRTTSVSLLNARMTLPWFGGIVSTQEPASKAPMSQAGPKGLVMLPGLMSLCTRPCWCAWDKASANGMNVSKNMRATSMLQ